MLLSQCVCAHAGTVVCVCCCGVTGLLSNCELCESASPAPSLSGPALRALPWTGAPRPTCRVLLIADHDGVTPRPYATTGKLIVLLPSRFWPVIRPMRELHGASLCISTKICSHRSSSGIDDFLPQATKRSLAKTLTANTHFFFFLAHTDSCSGVGCQQQRLPW